MEIIRQAIRSIIKPDSSLYKSGASVLDFLSVIKTEGYKTWRMLNNLSEGSEKDPIRAVKLRNVSYPIHIRPGTRDTHTIINNIVREEYGKLTNVTSPKWMIDAGAYIGDTTAYFLSRFPDLKVIALEPNPPSHEMAKLNLEPYGKRAILEKKGLYITNGIACFSGDSTGASIDNTGFEIDCTTVSSLMDQYSIPRIDILKMDIEGAEEAIFAANPATWLNRVDLLIVEIHCDPEKSLVPRALRENGFSMQQYRSIWYCRPVKK